MKEDSQQKNYEKKYGINYEVFVKSLACHDRSKHTDTRFPIITEHVDKKEIELNSMKIQDQVADIFTKPLMFKGVRGAVWIGFE